MALLVNFRLYVYLYWEWCAYWI